MPYKVKNVLSEQATFELDKKASTLLHFENRVPDSGFSTWGRYALRAFEEKYGLGKHALEFEKADFNKSKTIRMIKSKCVNHGVGFRFDAWISEMKKNKPIKLKIIKHNNCGCDKHLQSIMSKIPLRKNKVAASSTPAPPSLVQEGNDEVEDEEESSEEEEESIEEEEDDGEEEEDDGEEEEEEDDVEDEEEEVEEDETDGNNVLERNVRESAGEGSGIPAITVGEGNEVANQQRPLQHDPAACIDFTIDFCNFLAASTQKLLLHKGDQAVIQQQTRLITRRSQTFQASHSGLGAANGSNMEISQNREQPNDADIANIELQYNLRIEAYQKQIQDQGAKIANLNQENGALKKDVDEAKDENRAFQEEVGKLKVENGALKEDVGKLNEENSALKEEVGKLKVEKSALMEEVGKLSQNELVKQVEALKKEVSGLNHKNQCLNIHAKQTVTENQLLQKKYDELVSLFQKWKNEFSQLENKG